MLPICYTHSNSAHSQQKKLKLKFKKNWGARKPFYKLQYDACVSLMTYTSLLPSLTEFFIFFQPKYYFFYCTEDKSFHFKHASSSAHLYLSNYSTYDICSSLRLSLPLPTCIFPTTVHICSSLRLCLSLSTCICLITVYIPLFRLYLSLSTCISSKYISPFHFSDYFFRFPHISFQIYIPFSDYIFHFQLASFQIYNFNIPIYINISFFHWIFVYNLMNILNYSLLFRNVFFF